MQLDSIPLAMALAMMTLKHPDLDAMPLDDDGFDVMRHWQCNLTSGWRYLGTNLKSCKDPDSPTSLTGSLSFKYQY